jgi:hypothetical protein
MRVGNWRLSGLKFFILASFCTALHAQGVTHEQNTSKSTVDLALEGCALSTAERDEIRQLYKDFSDIKQDPFAWKEDERERERRNEEARNDKLNKVVRILLEKPDCADRTLSAFELVLKGERKGQPLVIRTQEEMLKAMQNFDLKPDHHESIAALIRDARRAIQGRIEKLPVFGNGFAVGTFGGEGPLLPKLANPLWKDTNYMYVYEDLSNRFLDPAKRAFYVQPYGGISWKAPENGHRVFEIHVPNNVEEVKAYAQRNYKEPNGLNGTYYAQIQAAKDGHWENGTITEALLAGPDSTALQVGSLNSDGSKGQKIEFKVTPALLRKAKITDVDGVATANLELKLYLRKLDSRKDPFKIELKIPLTQDEVQELQKSSP